ncbi:MAG: hypothetical protein K2N82_05420 [Lachnospiraceae bacterium]|nr:hypothetical protein [Lachnospiraceae bacterium]
MRYGVSVSLKISGNIVETLLFGAIFLLIDNTAFPSSFWGSADALVFISYLHYDLLDFDRISITEKWRNIRIYANNEITEELNKHSDKFEE